MPLDEETVYYGLGCPSHGEEYIRECSMCGIEFCSRCYRSSTICAECAEMAQNDDLDDDPDFEDVDNLKALLPDDGQEDEIERILADADSELPPEELMEG